MSTFSELAVGVNVSVFATSINTQFEAVRSMERGSTAPTIKPTGLLWNDTSDATYGECIKRWNGSTWDLVIDLGAPAVMANGSIALTGNLDFGGNKGVNLAAGTNAGDAIRKDQALLRDGTQAMAAAINLGGFKGTNAAAGTASTDLVRFDQLQPGRSGVFSYSDTTQITQAADPDNTFEVVEGGPETSDDGTFAPRVLKLRLQGNVTRQDNAAVVKNLIDPIDVEVVRWTGDTDWIEVANFETTSSGVFVSVEVKWKTSGGVGLGFWLRLTRDGAQLCDVATARYMAWSGVNQ